MLIRIKPTWALSEQDVTDEATYLNRRQVLRHMMETSMAIGGLGLMGCQSASPKPPTLERQPKQTPCMDPWSCGLDPTLKGFQAARRNPRYRVPERKVTSEVAAASYNNFYEFTTNKAQVWQKVGAFKTGGWTLKVSGLCKKPRVFDLDDLRKLPNEERLYRFRCVERWAMVVPWMGCRLRDVLRQVEPLSSAKWVRFVSYQNPKQMPGVRQQSWLPWPYYEGLRMDEATHNLTMLVTGMYGKPLPRQNGAPVRLIVPWKYGYKSAKSIVHIELVDKRPRTFWHDLQPAEYGFFSNVDPDVAHPRWSQRAESLIGTNRRVKTLPFNGYGQEVAHLYSSKEKGK